ncbi:MAG: very short patch repair endonuclease [Minwuia sp.]|uniref:very short patch repair endonuclease n=1 Tax=Minwuia sp. TaxID=2493630 RepID=UPI003A87178E
MPTDRFSNVEPTRSRNMASISSKDTKPEMIVRRIVRRLGYSGYRLHRKDLPGKPDLAFIGRRKAVFVHGCFWHQHSNPLCKRSHVPQSRLEYWEPKLIRNRERDRKNIESLETRGWRILTVWECQTKDLNSLSEKLLKFLSDQ